MKAHRTDLVSFAFGLLFLALALWWLLARILGLTLPPVGWFLAGALVVIGLLGLVGALRSGRHADRSPAAGTPPAETTVSAPYEAGPEWNQPPATTAADEGNRPAAGTVVDEWNRPVGGADADEWSRDAVTDLPRDGAEDRPADGPAGEPRWSPGPSPAEEPRTAEFGRGPATEEFPAVPDGADRTPRPPDGEQRPAG